MASKHSKSTSLQLFSEQKRIRWKRLLQELSESIFVASCARFVAVYFKSFSVGSGSLVHLFEEVFSAQNQQQQLKAIKKVMWSEPLSSCSCFRMLSFLHAGQTLLAAAQFSTRG